MDIVILAAGLGSRLKNLTSDRPKAMVSVKNKTLIDHAIDFIHQDKVNQIYVVGGYEFRVLQKHLEQKVKIKLIENKDYKKGSTLTIDKAIPYLNDSFLLMNVDHIYPSQMFEKIYQFADESKIIAMVDSDRDLVDDDMKVKLDEKARISRIDKKLTDYEAGYIGMTFIGKNMLEIYKNGLAEVIENQSGSANVEAVLDCLSKKINIDVLDLSGFGWHEVDTQEDKNKAEKAL